MSPDRQQPHHDHDGILALESGIFVLPCVLPIETMRVARLARSWLAVNGGVALIAALVCAVDKACTTFLPEKHLLASVASTGSLYALVFISCSLNLRGRRRFIGGKLDRPKQSPVLYSSIVWHPLGSILERYLHGAAQDGIAADVGVTLLSSSMVTFGASVVRLLAFEATFDFIFYFAHRAVHLPGVYDKVNVPLSKSKLNIKESDQNTPMIP